METIKIAFVIGIVWAIFMTGIMELLIPFSENEPIQFETLWIKGLIWFAIGIAAGFFIRGLSVYLAKKISNEKLF